MPNNVKSIIKNRTRLEKRYLQYRLYRRIANNIFHEVPLSPSERRVASLVLEIEAERLISKRHRGRPSAIETLGQAEVATILVTKHGFKPKVAISAAAYGGTAKDYERVARMERKLRASGVEVDADDDEVEKALAWLAKRNK